MARLEAIKGELEVTDLDRIAKCNFVEWVANTMYDAAREGAVLVEVRFGAEWVKWLDLMPRFREAERLVQSSYPDFCAEAIIFTHISHINPAGLAVISNGTTRCSRIAEYSGYHEC